MWAAAAWTGLCGVAGAQANFEDEPIGYSKRELADRVTRLRADLDANRARLAHDPKWGYLPALLQALDMPVESQTLVFSKTSFQLRRISPANPRAVYFGDDVYVGYVQGGDVLEVSSVDPHLGGVFFTLGQDADGPPRFERRTHECLQCHASSLTDNVPGHLVRSVFSDRQGYPILRAGTFVTTDASPFEERWGGWYVSGTHGAQRHMGNLTLDADQDRGDLDRDLGANVADLASRIDTTPYLSGHSDLVALMVLEHQTQMHNAITKANYQTRLALRDEAIIKEALGNASPEPTESTKRRVAHAAEGVVKRLLFAGEAKLTEPVRGTSRFAEQFASRGRRDDQGRSLRDLDLNTRLFRYPCSFLIGSDAFAALPELVRHPIYDRIDAILSERDPAPAFAHLSSEDRRAIRGILIATHADFAKRVASRD
ncbi:MAG: hypothetical protein FJ297_14545 [Planctomycetes bacterium]|nr:hypothetical protein [Planctomycetota bacterium]